MPDRNQKPRAIDAPEECFLRLRLKIHGGYVPARIQQKHSGISWPRLMGSPPGHDRCLGIRRHHNRGGMARPDPRSLARQTVLMGKRNG